MVSAEELASDLLPEKAALLVLKILCCIGTI
jgi:hypothetical protein